MFQLRSAATLCLGSFSCPWRAHEYNVHLQTELNYFIKPSYGALPTGLRVVLRYQNNTHYNKYAETRVEVCTLVTVCAITGIMAIKARNKALPRLYDLSSVQILFCLLARPYTRNKTALPLQRTGKVLLLEYHHGIEESEKYHQQKVQPPVYQT